MSRDIYRVTAKIYPFTATDKVTRMAINQYILACSKFQVHITATVTKSVGAKGDFGHFWTLAQHVNGCV